MPVHANSVKFHASSMAMACQVHEIPFQPHANSMKFHADWEIARERKAQYARQLNMHLGESNYWHGRPCLACKGSQKDFEFSSEHEIWLGMYVKPFWHWDQADPWKKRPDMHVKLFRHADQALMQ